MVRTGCVGAICILEDCKGSQEGCETEESKMRRRRVCPLCFGKLITILPHGPTNVRRKYRKKKNGEIDGGGTFIKPRHPSAEEYAEPKYRYNQVRYGLSTGGGWKQPTTLVCFRYPFSHDPRTMEEKEGE